MLVKISGTLQNRTEESFTTRKGTVYIKVNLILSTEDNSTVTVSAVARTVRRARSFAIGDHLNLLCSLTSFLYKDKWVHNLSLMDV